MPTLGYENGDPFGSPEGFKRGTGEDELNRFNQWMRSQPWHRAYLQSIGQADKKLNLSEQQQKQLAAVARQNGVNLPADDLSIDQAGNLNQNSRTARNIAIAGIAAAGVLTAGAALGAFGGAAGVGGAGGVGALEASAAPLGAAGIPGAAVGLGGAAGAAGTAASIAGTGTLGTMGKFASKLLGPGGELLSDAAGAVGAATQAAGNNRQDADLLRLRAEQNNEENLMNRGTAERAERNTANDDVYRASWYQNRQAGPNNPRGVTPMSPAYMQNLSDLEKMALEKLSKPAQYDTGNIAPLKTFTPTPQGTGEKIGTWAGPVLGGLGSLARYLKR